MDPDDQARRDARGQMSNLDKVRSSVKDPNSVQARLAALEARCAGYEAAMPRVVHRLQAVEAELQRLRGGFKSSD